jgi:serine O-acetyltransferase
MLNKLSNRYCIHIGLNVFEKGLRIVHLGPILVNGGAKVGKDCSVHINTVLAARGNSDESPMLGDNIVIGVGANLIGGIKIANGIAIGANSLVNKSFLEENIAIAGVPAKKISNNGRDTWHKVSPK